MCWDFKKKETQYERDEGKYERPFWTKRAKTGPKLHCQVPQTKGTWLFSFEWPMSENHYIIFVLMGDQWWFIGHSLYFVNILWVMHAAHGRPFPTYYCIWMLGWLHTFWKNLMAKHWLLWVLLYLNSVIIIDCLYFRTMCVFIFLCFITQSIKLGSSTWENIIDSTKPTLGGEVKTVSFYHWISGRSSISC